jgi:hypothetical protein
MKATQAVNGVRRSILLMEKMGKMRRVIMRVTMMTIRHHDYILHCVRCVVALPSFFELAANGSGSCADVVDTSSIMPLSCDKGLFGACFHIQKCLSSLVRGFASSHKFILLQTNRAGLYNRSMSISGSPVDDSLTVDLSLQQNCAPFHVYYNGGSEATTIGDSVTIIGSQEMRIEVEYTPSSMTFGSGRLSMNHNGSLIGVIDFDGLEPVLIP